MNFRRQRNAHKLVLRNSLNTFAHNTHADDMLGGFAKETKAAMLPSASASLQRASLQGTKTGGGKLSKKKASLKLAPLFRIE